MKLVKLITHFVISLLSCQLALSDCLYYAKANRVNELLTEYAKASGRSNKALRTAIKKDLFQELDEVDRSFDILEKTLSPTKLQFSTLSKLESIAFQDTLKPFTAEEIALLQQNNSFKSLLRASLQARKVMVPYQKFNENMGRFFSTRERALSYKTDKPHFLQKSVAFIGDVALRAFNFISPFELSPRNPLAKIFIKQAKRQVVSEQELALLAQKNLSHEYQARESIIKKYPKWQKFKLFMGKLSKRLKQATLGLSVALAVEMSTHVPYSTADDFIHATQNIEASNQVQILNETAPFPHTAIRIGNDVYSYGYEYITRSPIKSYLEFEKIQAVYKETNGIKMPTSSTAQYMAGESRSIQAITLQLSKDEMQALERELNEQVGKNYKNETLVNDCASMICRALRKTTSINVPSTLDASPFMLESYLYTFGSNKVKKIDLVLLNQSKNPNTHLLRNILINYAEGRIYQAGFIINQPKRIIMDLTHSDSQIQYLNEETQKTITEWQMTAKEEISSDPTVQILYERLLNPLNSTELEETRFLIQTYFEQKINPIRETLIVNSSADIQQLVESRAELSAIKDKIKQFIQYNELSTQMTKLLAEVELIQNTKAFKSK